MLLVADCTVLFATVFVVVAFGPHEDARDTAEVHSTCELATAVALIPC